MKIFVWEGFCIKGKISLYYFSQIMDAKFYIDILYIELSEIEDLLEDDW